MGFSGDFDVIPASLPHFASAWSLASRSEAPAGGGLGAAATSVILKISWRRAIAPVLAAPFDTFTLTELAEPQRQRACRQDGQGLDRARAGIHGSPW